MWLMPALVFQITVPGLTPSQRLRSVNGSTDTDPGLMLIKMNDLITVKRLQQNIKTFRTIGSATKENN